MARPFFFGGNQSSQQSQYLVQMKAGKMVKNGNTVCLIVLFFFSIKQLFDIQTFLLMNLLGKPNQRT